MLLESKYAAWLKAGLRQYRSNPLLIEAVFYDASHVGQPTALAPGLLDDRTKQWLDDEFVGGIVRWGMAMLPIVGNSATQLQLQGDLTALAPPPQGCYHIIPPATAGLTQVLQQTDVTVLTAFAQVPSILPAITIRLEREAQADVFIGDDQHLIEELGQPFMRRTQALTASYLLSIWAVNREAALWLYAWLSTYTLQSLGQFATWGLYDVAMAGSDLDPAMQYRAEHAYTRHLLLTATRQEHALTGWVSGPLVSDVCVRVCATYAPLAWPPPRLD